jgi:hypothetical protein
VTYETGVKTGVRLSQPDSTLDFRQLPLSTEAKLRQRSIVPVFQLRPHLAAAMLGGRYYKWYDTHLEYVL